MQNKACAKRVEVCKIKLVLKECRCAKCKFVQNQACVKGVVVCKIKFVQKEWRCAK